MFSTRAFRNLLAQFSNRERTTGFLHAVVDPDLIIPLDEVLLARDEQCARRGVAVEVPRAEAMHRVGCEEVRWEMLRCLSVGYLRGFFLWGTSYPWGEVLKHQEVQQYVEEEGTQQGDTEVKPREAPESH